MLDKYEKRVEEVSIEIVKPYFKNVKKGTNVEEVKNSIERFWYNDFIEVDEELVIINWHSRYKALKQLGFEKIKVNVIVGIPKKESQAYRIIHNKVWELNEDNMENLIIELRQIGDIDDMQQYFNDIDLPKFIKDDLGQSFKNIWGDEIEKQNDKMTEKFNSTESSNKDLQKSKEVICPECLHEFELRS